MKVMHAAGIASLAVFVEPAPGADFALVRRIPLPRARRRA
jgi:hypothetical protein